MHELSLDPRLPPRHSVRSACLLALVHRATALATRWRSTCSLPLAGCAYSRVHRGLPPVCSLALDLLAIARILRDLSLDVRAAARCRLPPGHSLRSRCELPLDARVTAPLGYRRGIRSARPACCRSFAGLPSDYSLPLVHRLSPGGEPGEWSEWRWAQARGPGCRQRARYRSACSLPLGLLATARPARYRSACSLPLGLLATARPARWRPWVGPSPGVLAGARPARCRWRVARCRASNGCRVTASVVSGVGAGPGVRLPPSCSLPLDMLAAARFPRDLLLAGCALARAHRRGPPRAPTRRSATAWVAVADLVVERGA
ncbi:hypothetical protein HNR71_002861 [Kribbella sandramycini]|uniref:Uncharacterized protein n=1 Tax=Kribbella sandramycini TaxID=60450 RepID=A0A841SC68_9ACTN|nr:hypothetical protein [Kribbella sandramycini]